MAWCWLDKNKNAGECMRVIGGEFRSRVLKSVPGLDTRPTPDRLREALFNVLAPRISGAVFADLYAGTGAVGIEALSRGASRAIFVEHSRAAANVIRENLRSLALEARAQVREGRALQTLKKIEADIIFLDPPYELVKEYAFALDLLSSGTASFVIVQHDVRLKLEESYGALNRERQMKQGDNVLSFYEIDSANVEPEPGRP
jgi:16S rRNA (guanine966-N2)-methyltransferase